MKPDRAKPDRWLEAEPSLADLMTDPIMALLLVGDGIDKHQVQRAVAEARRRMAGVSIRDWSAAAN